MNYFMSDLHGASNAYFEMKEKIGFRKNDELFILGDIFDGNDKNPGACIDILNDIMVSNNIHLILGNHEYAHIMYFVSKDVPEMSKKWEEYITTPAFQGTPLFRYISEKLSQKERERYIAYLVSCEMSEYIKIGHRYFYLVHGSPAVCKKGDVGSWQYDVVTIPLSFHHNYAMAIASDPGENTPKGATNENTFVIAGHIPTKYVFEEWEEISERYYKKEDVKYQKIVVENKKLLIDCGCSGNTLGKPDREWISNLGCVGIDAAGFFTEYLI